MLALLVTLVTLGRVRVEWSGRPSTTDGSRDPAAPTRVLGEGGRT